MSGLEIIVARIRKGASAARARLEGVLLELYEMPSGVDLGPLSARVSEALEGLGRLSEMAPEDALFFETIDAAAAAVDKAVREVAPLGEAAPVLRTGDRLRTARARIAALREASIDALVALQDLRARAEMPRVETITPVFRASVGAPSLHAVLRAPPRVIVDLYRPAEHGALNDAEDVMEPPPSEAPAPPRSPDEALLLDHTRAMARSCLHEMTSLAALRSPLPESPWIHGEPFERRLLANLDALLALEVEPRGLPPDFSVFEEVQRYARQASAVDPGREFARALTFACTRGDPALRAVVLLLKQAHPATLPVQQIALCLARHPHTAEMMRELLGENDAALVALAVEVLRFLREARVPDLSTLAAHPAPRVRSAVLRALGFVPERKAAAELLVEALLDEDDRLVALEAAESLVRAGRIEGLEWARERLDAGLPAEDIKARIGCLRLVAIAGGEADVERMVSVLGVAPREAILAGLYGHPGVVETLLEMLSAANRIRRSTGPWTHPLEVAAARSLVRVTGVLLRDEPGEVVDYDFAHGPTIFAETWRGFWEEQRGSVPVGVKLRWGQPFTPVGTARELGEPCPAALREDLELELAIGLGDAGFEPTDWVARQRVILSAYEQRAEEPSYPVGLFPDVMLGRG